MRIAILALAGLFDTGLTVLLDAFTLANKFSGAQTGGRPPFDLSVVGVRRRVRSGQGLLIPVQAITPDLKPDWVIVPALGTGRPEQLIPALARRVGQPDNCCEIPMSFTNRGEDVDPRAEALGNRCGSRPKEPLGRPSLA